MKAEVDAIIFDLGGVILEVDYQRTVDAFKHLGMSEFDTLYSKQNQTRVFDLLETGKIGAAEFRNWVKARIKSTTDKEIDQAWNAIILDFPDGRLEYLAKLNDMKSCFLLSNTNEIHAAYFNDILRTHYKVDSIHALFEKAYLSHEIGLRKPDSAIFELILDENGLKPEHTLFIDDSEQHINSAHQLGIQTILLDSIDQLESELAPFLA